MARSICSNCGASWLRLPEDQDFRCPNCMRDEQRKERYAILVLTVLVLALTAIYMAGR